MISKKGFTLVEVLIGTAILGVVSLTGFHFFIHGSNFIERAARRERALQLASGKMELLRGATDFAIIEDYEETVHDINGTDFTVNVDVPEAENGDNGAAATKHRLVNLEVTWDDEDESLELSTYIIEK